jgi:hypothetical protein
MRVSAEEKKLQLLVEIKAARQEVLEAAASLPPDQRETIFLGYWSTMDIIAHLIGWDIANAEAVRAILAGELPPFYAHRDRDWRSFNDHLVQCFRRDDFRELCHEAMVSHWALIDLLNPIPADEFERDRGIRFRGYKVTIARLLKADAKDGVIHAEQIRSFASKLATP